MTAPWPALPPEDAYALLVGPNVSGEATTVASGAAWQAQTIESVTHAALSQSNAVMTQPGWIGLGGAASTMTATVMNAVLTALSGWCEETVPIAEAAAGAYRAAASTMFNTAVCEQNRTEQAGDVAINPLVWGALTPDIARLDGTYYGLYWTTNATEGTTYATVLTGFLSALAIPPPLGPLSVSPTAPAAAAEQVAEATAQGAAGDGMRSSAQAAADFGGQSSSAQSMLEPLMSAAQAPLSGAQSLTSPVENGLQAFTSPVSQFAGMFGQFGSGGAMTPTAGGGVPVSTAMGATSLGASAGGGGSGLAGGSTGYAGTGLTSYTRPTSSFSPESSGGRASYAKPGLARPGGAAAAPVTGGAPISPAGMMRHGESGKGKDGETRTAKLSAPIRA